MIQDVDSFLILVSRLSLATGVVAYFLHWCIGSPEGQQGEPNIFKVNTGRIFSKYGIWVIKRFNLHEQSENKRLGAIFNKKADIISTEYERRIKYNLSTSTGDIEEETNHLQNELMTELSHLKSKTELYRRMNWYKPLGACFTCFSVWVGSMQFILFFIFNILIISKLAFIFVIPSIAASVVFSKLINKVLK